MKHVAAYFNTRHGRAGVVFSGETFDKIEQSLDTIPRAHKSDSELGLVGYLGCDSLKDAVADAMRWERREYQGGAA